MQRINSFVEAKRYLSRYYTNTGAKFNLDNISKLMGYLGNPQDHLKVIHVAGTSGKTSTTYFMASLLALSGQEIGHTTSPVVYEVNERIQINGMPLKESEFCRWLEEFSGCVEASGLEPSYFEFMTAFAYWYFAKREVDYAVIEVGLGGLKDATNVVTRGSKVCLITDIGMDHMNLLGNSLSEIAAQKAGIIQEGNAVFMYEQSPEIMRSVIKVVEDKRAELNLVTPLGIEVADIADYQKRNWNLAYSAYLYLAERDNLNRLSDAQLYRSIHTQVPGRMEILKLGNKTVVLDGAHNAQKVRTFVESLKNMFPGKTPALLIAIKDDKDYEAMARLLAPLASRVITTNLESDDERPASSVPAEVLAQAFSGKVEVSAIPDITEAYKQLLESESDLLVITGSIFLLGRVRKLTGLKMEELNV